MFVAKLITDFSVGNIIEIVALFVTLLVAIGTLALAWNSRNTLWEMKAARDIETTPYVIVYFDVPHGKMWADLVVKNIGKGVARNVRMEFRPELVNTENHDLMGLPMIRDGIPMMPPEYEIRTTFDFTKRYFDAGLPMHYDVQLTYTGGIGNAPRENECVADLSPFQHLTHIVRHDMHDLVTRTERLTAEIKNFHRSYNANVRSAGVDQTESANSEETIGTGIVARLIRYFQERRG